jgi:hypothetical protein
VGVLLDAFAMLSRSRMRRLLRDDSFRARLAAGARTSAAGRSRDSILSGLFEHYAAAMLPAASRVA